MRNLMTALILLLAYSKAFAAIPQKVLSDEFSMKNAISQCLQAGKVKIQTNGYLRIYVSPKLIEDIRDENIVLFKSEADLIKEYDSEHQRYYGTPSSSVIKYFRGSYKASEDNLSRFDLLTQALNTKENVDIWKLAVRAMVRLENDTDPDWLTMDNKTNLLKDWIILKSLYDLFNSCEEKDEETKVIKIKL